MSDLEPLDPFYVADALSRPPFVKIDGVHNVRDIGLCHHSIIRQNFAFRSAEIAGITEEGASPCTNLLLSPPIEPLSFRKSADASSWDYPSV
jgi:hypothetical protein